MLEGVSDVGANYTKAELAHAIATMPGGYVLFFLDSQPYDAHKDLLEDDAYPLLDYPCRDATDFTRVDPYHPEIRDDECRYHEFGWDLAPYIAEGFEQYKLTPQKLDDSIKQRFHNIR